MESLKPYPWQEQEWRGLWERQIKGRLPHALLFAGPAGLGKRRLAGILTQALICEHPLEDGTGCGRCRGCKLCSAGTHPDVLRIEPEEEGKDVGIEAVRELARYQGLSRQYASHKVIVINPADRLTSSAANALLKTLEEPTMGTVLLLIADHPEALLPTIRSRCQMVALKPVWDEPAVTWLQRQMDATQDDGAKLLRIAGGAPLAALHMAEEGLMARRHAFLESLEKLVNVTISPMWVAEEAMTEGPQRIIAWLQSWVADMVRLRVNAEPQTLSNPDIARRLQALCEGVDLGRLYGYLDRLQQARRSLDTAVNTRLLLEELVVLWPRVLATDRR